MSEEISLTEALSVARGMVNHSRAFEKIQGVLILVARAEGLVDDSKKRFDELTESIRVAGKEQEELRVAIVEAQGVLSRTRADIRALKEHYAVLSKKQEVEYNERAARIHQECAAIREAAEKQLAETRLVEAVRLETDRSAREARIAELTLEETRLSGIVASLRSEIQSLRQRFA